MFVARNFVRIWHSYASISTKNNHMMTKTLYIKATICYTICYNHNMKIEDVINKDTITSVIAVFGLIAVYYQVQQSNKCSLFE